MSLILVWGYLIPQRDKQKAWGDILMEFIRTMKQFMEIVSHGNNILYGAGKTGRYIHDFLRHRDVSVMAFTVTQLNQEEKVGGSGLLPG